MQRAISLSLYTRTNIHMAGTRINLRNYERVSKNMLETEPYNKTKVIAGQRESKFESQVDILCSRS